MDFSPFVSIVVTEFLEHKDRTMLTQSQKQSMVVEDVPDGVFFRVVSPDSPYVSKFMIYILDEDLPHKMRQNKLASMLFLVRHVDPGIGRRAQVVVDEVKDLAHTTLVHPESPLQTTMHNGAEIVLRHDDAVQVDYHPVRVAKLDQKCEVEHLYHSKKKAG
jgi:hypothetical protein